MSHHPNKSGEMLHVAIITAIAAIVGLLILVQLFRAQPMDVPSMLVIAVCFVVAVVLTSLWSKRSGR
ncbi:MAG TPA: hypothetical protein VEI97_14820 [bacterium]|nr:hypothetical protein [bacterium]